MNTTSNGSKRPPPPARIGTGAFSLVEILVAITIIVVLIGILLPAIGMARGKVKQSHARQTVGELRLAFDLYRAEDPQKRYPTVRPDLGIHRDLVEDLDQRRMWSQGRRQIGGDGLLLDPWNQPFRYSQTRPAPTRGVEALRAWNWDMDAGHEAHWGQLVDPATGTLSSGPLPYPYLWSLGRRGTTDNADTWIFAEDGQ